jgi:hypothetical protein
VSLYVCPRCRLLQPPDDPMHCASCNDGPLNPLSARRVVTGLRPRADTLALRIIELVLVGGGLLLLWQGVCALSGDRDRDPGTILVIVGPITILLGVGATRDLPKELPRDRRRLRWSTVAPPEWPRAPAQRATARALDGQAPLATALHVLAPDGGLIARRMSAVDFQLVPDEGEPILVTGVIELVGDGTPADPELPADLHTPAKSPAVGSRCVLADGDRVEFAGEPKREMLPSGYRDEPQLVLRGEPGRPAVVRRL